MVKRYSNISSISLLPLLIYTIFTEKYPNCYQLVENTTANISQVEDHTVPGSREKAGPVASDSLAAESSSFQSTNRGAEPLGVKGANSTLANEDISAARTLEPTDQASSRPENREEYPDETTKMGHFTKTDNKNHSVIRDTNLKNYHHTNDGSLDDQGRPAPTYVDPVVEGAGISGANLKPHGKNLHEIPKDQKFDGEEKQPKGGMGGREDEDRAAMADIARNNAIRETAGSGVNAGTKGSGGSQYDALNNEENA